MIDKYPKIAAVMAEADVEISILIVKSSLERLVILDKTTPFPIGGGIVKF